MNLVGQVFGRLTVVALAEPRFTPKGAKIIRWECICSCDGKKHISPQQTLRKGEAKSCGCLQAGNRYNRNGL